MTILPSDESPDPPTRYATFTSRMRAALIDTFVVATALVAIFMIGDAAADVPGSGRVAVLLIFGLALLYEPLLVWRRGATIGHRRNHLMVVSEATGRSPGLARAFLRYLVKAIFGIVSFGTMPLSRRHQAVHDWVTRTTVRVAPGAEELVEEFHLELSDGPDELSPSRSRRALVGLAYLIALLVANGIAVSIVDPERCARARSCDGATTLMLRALGVTWIALSCATIIAAWKGLLWGARRRPASRAAAPLA